MERGRSGFEAILLAAGASTRMGAPKSLIEWCRRPLIAFQVEEFLATRIDRIVVVLGARADEVREQLLQALAQRKLRVLEHRLAIAVNRDWESGKCGSIRVGVSHLSCDVHDVVLHSVDQPTSAEVLEALLGFHRAAGQVATLPVRNGRRGHPVCVRSTLRAELADLREEDLGLRGLLRALEGRGFVHAAPVAAPCIHWNINRPEDLARLRSRPVS